MSRSHHVGCSGYQYQRWTGGAYYPPGCRDFLSYYSSQLGSVEINASFYRIPTPKTTRRWRESTPDDFTFVLKGTKVVTHNRRINGSDAQEEALERFAQAADELGPKLVGVLWQFPPTFHATSVNLDRLGRFMDSVHNRLPGNSFEFRHQSWLDVGVHRTVADRGLSFVRHDHHHLRCLHVPHDSREPLIYTRYHGPRGDCRGSYSEDFLRNQASQHQRRPALLYFNNDIDVGAPFNAKRLEHLLIAS